MPKIEFKESTLNDQAFIVKYADRKFLVLRVARGGKRYTNVSLNTSDLQQARKNALSAYIKIENDPPKSRTRKLSFEKACEDYLKEKEIDVVRGQLASRSQDLYRQRIYQRILPYCRVKGIRSIADINKNSFLEYGGYYLDVTQKGKWKTNTLGLSPGTINSDITTLKAILNWMVRKELLDPKKKPELVKVKDRKNYKEESNPAFLPDDWTKFKDHLYRIEDGISDEEVLWKRRWFINWVRFQFQSGCRPHETHQIRCGDCEVVKRSDGKLSGIIRVSNTTKTGGREVAMNGSTVKKIRSHLNKGIKIRNRQIEVQNQLLIAEYGNGAGGKLLPLISLASKDDLLLMNPFSADRSVFHMEHIRQWFKRVLSRCKFERNYTLYSLRATHISYALLKGQRIDLIAKNCGTSLAMIQKTYDGLSSRFSIDSLGFYQESSSFDED